MAKDSGTAKETVENKTGATENKLPVTREPFKSKGKTYLAYLIKGKLRGRDIKIDLMPQKAGRNIDGGGYEVLDLVFGDAETAELIQQFETYQQDGKTQTRTVYIVRNPDPDIPGEYFECSVIPARPSDRALLEMLLTRIS